MGNRHFYSLSHKMCCMSATSDLIRRLVATGLTQTAIAKRTGIPQPRLSRWASGKPACGADDALRLAELERELAAQGGNTPAATQGQEASHVPA
jgi:transcriptional regulator with XRE-family HTH domain